VRVHATATVDSTASAATATASCSCSGSAVAAELAVAVGVTVMHEHRAQETFFSLQSPFLLQWSGSGSGTWDVREGAQGAVISHSPIPDFPISRVRVRSSVDVDIDIDTHHANALSLRLGRLCGLPMPVVVRSRRRSLAASSRAEPHRPRWNFRWFSRSRPTRRICTATRLLSSLFSTATALGASLGASLGTSICTSVLSISLSSRHANAIRSAGAFPPGTDITVLQLTIADRPTDRQI
jgi:hypothetical protein